MRTDVQGRIREAVPELAIATDAVGRPRVSPARTDDVAAVLPLATAEGWRVRVEARATWCPADAPAELVLTTGRLDRIVAAAAGDLVATIEAGAFLARLRCSPERFDGPGPFSSSCGCPPPPTSR